MLKEYHARQAEFREVFAGSGSGPDEFDDFWLEYESRYEQTRKLRTFLGRDLYRKLIDRFGFNN
jgi:hypothetical protein